MKYDFYDDISMMNNFMPYDNKLGNMPSNSSNLGNDMNSMSFNMSGYTDMNFSSNLDNNIKSHFDDDKFSSMDDKFSNFESNKFNSSMDIKQFSNFLNNKFNDGENDKFSTLDDYKFSNVDMNNLNSKVEMNSLNLYSPYEGYVRGNAFQNQYVPYKNYKPQRINITSEKEEMLVNIGQYSFMAHEMNLYLDTHPTSREALSKFQEYRDKANELIKTYERKYGPLTVSGDLSNQTPFNWVTTTWPWVE